MLHQLSAAAKAASLTYRIVLSVVMVGVVAYEATKYVKRERERKQGISGS